MQQEQNYNNEVWKIFWLILLQKYDQSVEGFVFATAV